MLHERGRELAVIADLVERARSGRGAAVGVTGPIGSGRSALLAAAGAAAAQAGAVVLRARGTPLEHGFAFGVARQLLEPGASGASGAGVASLDGLGDDLARAALDDLDEAAAARLQRAFALLLDEVRACTAEAPVLLVVDDHQWTDPASRHWLRHLGARLDRLRVVVVVAVLAGEGAALGWSPRELHDDAVELPLDALSPAAMAATVAERCGETAEPAFLAALDDLGGRVPLVLDHVLGEVVAAGMRPLDGGADQVRAMRPARLRERLVGILRAQPAPVRHFLAALAVCPSPVDPELPGRLAHLDPVDRSITHDAGRRLGLVVDDPSPRLVEHAREAVDALLSSAERRDLHLRAAALGRDRTLGNEWVAARLTAVSPPLPPWALDVLRRAAAAAVRRGDPLAALAPLRHILMVLPSDGPERGEVLVELGAVERDLDMGLAVRRIAQALPLLPDVADRARALALVPVSAMIDLSAAMVRTVREVLAELAPAGHDAVAGPAREAALQLEARLRYLELDTQAGLEAAVDRLEGLGEPFVDTPAERDLSAVLVYAAALSGRADAHRTAEDARMILRHEPASAEHAHRPVALVVDCGCLADVVVDLLPWLEEALDEALRRRARATEAIVRAELAAVLVCSGRSSEGEVQARHAYALLHDGLVDDSRLPGAVLGPLLLIMLDASSASAMVDRYRDEALRSTAFGTVLQLLRARVATDQGAPAEALRYCLEAGSRLEQVGRGGVVPLPWRPWAAALASGLGRHDQARDLAEAEYAEALRWGAPLAQGRALRMLAVGAAPEAGGRLLERAVEVLRASADRRQLATALRELAAHRREHGGDGAAPLEAEAAGLDRELGAAAPVSTGSAAPRSAGEPSGPSGPPGPSEPSEPRGPGANGSAARAVVALTRSERRVAGLAASGITNQDIAEQLEVSVRAVEKHLTSTYRKLGIAGRAALAEMWAGARGDGGPSTASLSNGHR